MADKFGPSPAELRFRLWFSVVGLALTVLAVSVRGLPATPASIEVIAIAVAFFGGTLVWTLCKTWRRGGSHSRER